MDISSGVMKPSLCKDCGCRCDGCSNGTSSYLDLHQQIAELHSQLGRNGTHIGSLEQQLSDARSTTDFELSRTRDELARLRERYDRLLESHKKMQKLNHDLEDKLLRQVGQAESEKVSLQQELSSMMKRLVEARTLIGQLDEDNERYRQDCNVAVQLLQCKPSNFVAHRLNTLPLDLQERLKQLMPRDQFIAAETAANTKEESRLVRIPIATFPPTAMVYSLQQKLPESKEVNKGHSTDGLIPTSLIAKALTQPRPQKLIPQVYLCQTCRQDFVHKDSGCQVDLLSRGSRPVEITTLPARSDRFGNLVQSPCAITSPTNVDNKGQGFFVFSNGTQSVHYDPDPLRQQHSLSMSGSDIIDL